MFDFNLDDYCKEISFLLNYPMVLINLDKGDHFNQIGAFGFEKQMIKKEDSICREVVENLEHLSLTSLKTSKYSDNFYVQQGLQTYLGVPLWVNDRIVGVLCAIDTNERFPTQKEIDFLYFFSKEISQKIKYVSQNLTLTKYNELLNEAQELGKISNWEWNFENDSIIWSDYNFKLFERDSKTFELSFENYLSHLSKEDVEKVNSTFSEIKNGHKNDYSLEHWITTGLGNKKYIKEIGHVERNPDGAIVRMYGTSQDITETKRMQETIEVQQQKLYYSNKMSFLGQMASSVSHEINNPLSVILGYIELAKEEKEIENIELYIQKIEKSVTRIKEVVYQLSYFSKPKNKNSDDCNNVVLDQVYSFLFQKAERKNIEMTLTKNIVSLKVDPNEMFQVYFNLITNSIESLENSESQFKKIEIIGSETDEHILIEFIDSGDLIPENVREKLFTPFFTTKLNSNKLGLGLSVAKDNSSKNNFDIGFNIKDNKNCFSLKYYKNSI